MTIDTQQHQQHGRMWQGIAVAEDLYGRMASSLMPMFQAHGFVATVRRRHAASDPWGPATIAFHRGFDPAMLDAVSGRPDDIFSAMGGLAVSSDTCEVKLSLVRSA